MGTFWVDGFFCGIFPSQLHRCGGNDGFGRHAQVRGAFYFVLNTRLRRVLVDGQCINAFELQGWKIVNFIAKFQYRLYQFDVTKITICGNCGVIVHFHCEGFISIISDVMKHCSS